ncbi:fumarylacetoacetate hydrolase family protein [Aerosticca soli]|jgi:fumarylpyruvate hydrolase|uniref:Fumarylacetoacetate hydrolase family protein n=1 Tax=Aerosticca soli TaxID=2010829 RepID=A0A2Z6E5T0_9GAMM|nr:fumarylacetoacetate hydrolase family protein [Aerosticca soli]MDI3261497.1 fumarylacetoacetate hydrolase family protein [Fulvimonas sp.]BBD80337.1 fumarylacetoacetate hydrolase family protein [Aerosticca soli]
MSYVIDPPPQVSVPVLGSAARFPVRRVFCIGRNYADHAREMGATVDTAAPIFFCKPADALVTDGADVPYPAATAELHHEVEMVVALARGGREIEPAAAEGLIFGHGVGLDLTRRDLQARAKARGEPWDAAKAFDHSAPLSALCPLERARPHADTLLSLTVNGELRQSARLADMLLNVPAILAALSRLFELRPGDLVFTGTPAGVGPLRCGDRFHAALDGVATLDGRIVQA